MMNCKMIDSSDKDYQEYKSLMSEFGDVSDFSKEKYDSIVLDSIQKMIFLFHVENICVGTVSAMFDYKPFHDAVSIRLEEVVISEDYRHKGFGKQMIGHILKVVSENNKQKKSQSERIYKVTLSCNEGNVGFYESLGFKRNEVEMRLDVN